MYEIELISNFLKENDLDKIDYNEVYNRLKQLYPGATFAYERISELGYSNVYYRIAGIKTSVLKARLWAQIYYNDLLKGYEVHHDDEIKLNNKLSNLIVKSKVDHAYEHRKYDELVEFTCTKCNDKFNVDRLNARRCTWNLNNGRNNICPKCKV